MSNYHIGPFSSEEKAEEVWKSIPEVKDFWSIDHIQVAVTEDLNGFWIVVRNDQGNRWYPAPYYGPDDWF